MRQFAVAMAVSGAVVMAGCAFDLTEMDSTREALLVISLDIPDCRSPLGVTALFHPGLERDGSVRFLGNDTLVFDTQRIPAGEVRSDGSRVYSRFEFDLDAISVSRVLHLRSPSVASIAEPPPQLSMEILRASAPDTLIVPRAGMVAITVEGARGGSMGAGGDGLVRNRADGFWFLDVRPEPAGPRILSMNGGAFPATAIQFPASLLPVSFTSGWVELHGTFRHGLSTAGGSYTVQVNRSFRCSVPLRLVD